MLAYALCFSLSIGAQTQSKIDVKKPATASRDSTRASLETVFPANIIVHKDVPVTGARPANCFAMVLGRSSGQITLNEIGAIDSLEVSAGCNCEIISFELFFISDHGLMEFENGTRYFEPFAKSSMQKIKPGKKLMLENIKAKNKTNGQVCRLPDLKFTITP